MSIKQHQGYMRALPSPSSSSSISKRLHLQQLQPHWSPIVIIIAHRLINHSTSIKSSPPPIQLCWPSVASPTSRRPQRLQLSTTHFLNNNLAASPHRFRRTIQTSLNVLSQSSPHCPATDLCRLPHKPPALRPQPSTPQAHRPLPRSGFNHSHLRHACLIPRTSQQASPSSLNRSLIISITTNLTSSPSPQLAPRHQYLVLLHLLPLFKGILLLPAINSSNYVIIFLLWFSTNSPLLLLQSFILLDLLSSLLP